MKILKFMGDSQAALATFPMDAKREAGFELWQVQLGLMPSDFKPKTAKPDIDLAAKRYKLIGVEHGKT